VYASTDTLASEVFTKLLTTASNFKQHKKMLIKSYATVQYTGRNMYNLQLLKSKSQKVPSNHLTKLKEA